MMQNKDEAKALLEAIGVCCEITGTEISEVAARVMADDLARYPHQQVLGALTRCRREVRSRLTLADVIERLDDGRPGPQEAWAVVAPTLHDEGVTVVRTREMAVAFGVALGLADDPIAARMAFLVRGGAICDAAGRVGSIAGP
jgi:glutamate formiminotransferase